MKRYALKKFMERMEKKGKKWMGPPKGCFKGWHTPECKDKRARKKQEWKRHIPRMPDWPPPDEQSPQDPYPPPYVDPGHVQPQQQAVGSRRHHPHDMLRNPSSRRWRPPRTT